MGRLFVLGTSSYPRFESATPEPPTMSFISCSFDMTMYENRLKSFDSGWYISFITPSQMAKAGFYYLGLHDRVRCMYCAKEFDYWKHGDDPSIRHKSISPECSFFDENNGNSNQCYMRYILLYFIKNITRTVIRFF